MHIDADMLVVPHISTTVNEMLQNKSVALVSHPGYWREEGSERIKLYFKNIKLFIKDAILVIKYGKIGTWSRKKNSHAYVTRSKRKEYLCGAVWFGEKNALLNLARELATLTEIDLLNGAIPEWNDESYLNYWASKNDYTRINPSFCFGENYKHLENINPIIIALDKNQK